MLLHAAIFMLLHAAIKASSHETHHFFAFSSYYSLPLFYVVFMKHTWVTDERWFVLIHETKSLSSRHLPIRMMANLLCHLEHGLRKVGSSYETKTKPIDRKTAHKRAANGRAR